jgi:hypothetical protein
MMLFTVRDCNIAVSRIDPEEQNDGDKSAQKKSRALTARESRFHIFC